MPRDLTAAMQASLAEESGPEVVWLILASFSGGDVRLCTASQDIDWDSETWEAVGGSISFGAIQEDPDVESQGAAITLPAVDQALVQRLLTEHFIGRAIKIWKAHLDPSTGLPVADPVLAFAGEMLDDWRIVTDREEGRSRIEGRAVSRVGRSAVTPILRMNPESHGQFFAGDLFYEHVAGLATKKVTWAGLQAPANRRSA